uniref:C3H1-type domain-containing protein n=1 Tax=Gouania willdenowi TaxID=441366 RepID=A0A8C5HSQ9_GOUWI
MLRSTGFFRGIDCPFYSDSSAGRGCSRPYCHFRHSRHRRSSVGSPAEGKQLKDQHSAHREQGYDPFNPEVGGPQEQQNGKPTASGDLSGALEQVNRAIEEARSEVEWEKRKLSRIEDEPYNTNERVVASSTDAVKSKLAGSHLAYDPGSYQITSQGYKPTPGCSKYTLDSDNQGHSSSSMEYVPTSLKKASQQTNPFTPPLPNAKYSNNSTSSKCKYTLDNSKPSTDMEYDPLSNYTAGISVKSKRGDGGSTVKSKTEINSTNKLSDEKYTVGVKTPQQLSKDSKKYTVSDSDGESSGTEYRPTSLSNIQQRKSSSGTAGGLLEKERKMRTDSLINALTQRNKEENSDGQENEKRKSVSKPEKAGKKLEDGVKKLLCSKSSSSSKEKGSIKTSNQDSAKKENKSDGKRGDQKSLEKPSCLQKNSKAEKGSEGKVKVKTSSNKRDRNTKESTKESKKLKSTHRETKESKSKRHHLKNGKVEGDKRAKDGKKARTSNSIGSNVNKEKVKHASSSSNDKKLEDKRLNLSHADLFGVESPDEADSMDEDYDDEILVRKSADALKRGRQNKRKASERTPSVSEEDEGDSHTEDVDLDFDSDPMEECLRIFNESKDVKREDKGRQAKQLSRDLEEEKSTDSTLTTVYPGQKKRVSHCVVKGNVMQSQRRLTAQEVCYQRLQMAQQQVAQFKVATQNSSHSSSGEKKRIAHRPIGSKPAVTRVLSPSHTSQTFKVQTTAGILSKTSSTTMQKRVAHMPTMKSTSMKRPIIPMEFGAKVPTNVRQRYLNTFIDECAKFCPSEEIAFQMALDEEKLVYERSSSKNIYLNIAVNTLKKLRSQISSQPALTSVSDAKRRPQSHAEVLGGRLTTANYTLNRMGKQQEEKLTGATLYRKLKAYLMTEEQLQEHGYPRTNPEAPGKAVIFKTEKKVISDPFNKICCRCGAEYKINAKGNCLRKEECSFHWGRLQRRKVAGSWETNYSCCSGSVGALGCQTAKQHVQDGRKECVDGYVSTFSKPLAPDGNGGVFALDCEMCYTKQGLELTRVTVINAEMKVIYDTFVKPQSQVVDYNTRFSGVTEEDLDSVTITLRDVQAVLLSMFSADSILIGHSLESDLLALKLIHSSVVDTAIVFPHRLGLPYKRALRNLMADHLRRIIQDNVEGHDSSEDASACMELMIWKIKEDAKVKR